MIFLILLWIVWYDKDLASTQAICCADEMQICISLNTQDMRLCVALPLRVGYPLGGWGSSFLSQPAEWWEPSTG